MNEKFNKNTKVEQLTNMCLSCGEEKGLTVKDPLFTKFGFSAKEKLALTTIESSGIRLQNNM